MLQVRHFFVPSRSLNRVGLKSTFFSKEPRIFEGIAAQSSRALGYLTPVQSQTRRNSSWGFRESLGRRRL